MKCSGFSLIQLVITTAILAGAATMATPGFAYLLEGGEFTASSNYLYGAMKHARSHAMQQGKNTYVSTLSSELDWKDGYQVWVDEDNNHQYSQGEELRTYEASHPSVSYQTEVQHIAFDKDGLALKTGTIFICSTKQRSNRVSVLLSGQIRLSDRAHCQ